MSVGSIFLIVAVVLFFFAGVGVAFIPSPTTWGLCCMAPGLLLNGVPIRRASG